MAKLHRNLLQTCKFDDDIHSSAGNKYGILPAIMEKYNYICPFAAPQKEANYKASIESERANPHEILEDNKAKVNEMLQKGYDLHHGNKPEASKEASKSMKRKDLWYPNSGEVIPWRLKSAMMSQLMSQYQLTRLNPNRDSK